MALIIVYYRRAIIFSHTRSGVPLFYPCDDISIRHECEGGVEKSVLRITDWHHEACQVMTNGDHERRIFYPALTRKMDSFSCSQLDTSFYPTLTRIMDSFSSSPLIERTYKSFQKFLNSLGATWWRHFNITMFGHTANGNKGEIISYSTH